MTTLLTISAYVSLFMGCFLFSIWFENKLYFHSLFVNNKKAPGGLKVDIHFAIACFFIVMALRYLFLGK